MYKNLLNEVQKKIKQKCYTSFDYWIGASKINPCYKKKQNHIQHVGLSVLDAWYFV